MHAYVTILSFVARRARVILKGDFRGATLRGDLGEAICRGDFEGLILGSES